MPQPRAEVNRGTREGSVPGYVERGRSAARAGGEPEGDGEADQGGAPTPEPLEPVAEAPAAAAAPVEVETAALTQETAAAAPVEVETSAAAPAQVETAALAQETAAAAPVEVETAAPAQDTAAPAQETAAAAQEIAAPVPADGAGPGTLTRPPLLASEALMEDLAPMEPARGGARLWCAAIGVSFMVLGTLSITGVRPGGGSSGASAAVLGGVALMAALTRITYRQRAASMVALGVLAAVLGLAGSGPAVGISVGGAGWGAARAIAAAALPAALLFRSRYRAYAGARWLLGAAFGAALPFLGYVVFRLMTHAFGFGEAGAVLAVFAMIAGLFGFMGAETTSAGAWLAFGVIVALAADLAFIGLALLAPVTIAGAVGVVAAALSFGATSALTSIGLFQIVAWRLAPDARRIDLHPHPKKEKESSRPRSGTDWLS